MGMRTYAVSDYGLYVVTADVEAYAERRGLNAFDLLIETGNHHGDVEGECCVIINESETFSCDESFAIFPLDKYPSLFNQAYENIEATLRELKENYAEYLPDDFDYKGKFVRVVGTVFG